MYESMTVGDLILSGEEVVLIRIYRQFGLSKEAMTALIRFMTHPKFNPDNLPRTLAQLLQKEDSFLSGIRIFRATMPNGAKIVFQNPCDIIQHFLLSKYAKDVGWYWEANEGNISNPLHTDGSFEISSFVSAEIARDVKLIYLNLFCDGFQLLRSKDSTTKGIYMSFAAAGMEAPKFLFCLVPEDAHIQEVIRFLIYLLMPYESPQLFMHGPQKVEETFITSLFLQIGDHMGQVELEGLVGPVGKHPCRFCYRTKKCLCLTALDDADGERTVHQLVELQERIRQLKSTTGNTAEIAELQTKTGMLEVTPAYLLLKYFPTSYYKRFTICLLHLMLLGMLKKVTNFALATMTEADRDALNAIVKTFPCEKWGITERLDAVWKTYSTSSANHPSGSKVGMINFTGGKMEVWARIAPEVLRGLTTDPVLSAVSSLCEVYLILKLPSFDRYTLSELTTKIVACADTIVKAFKDYPKLHDKLNFINFHTFAMHWVDQIIFSGTPISTSTQLFEALNKYVKALALHTNSVDVLRDVMHRHNAMAQFNPDTFRPHMPNGQYERYLEFEQHIFPTPTPRARTGAGLGTTQEALISPAERDLIHQQLDILANRRNIKTVLPISLLANGMEIYPGLTVQIGTSTVDPTHRDFFRDVTICEIKEIFVLEDVAGIKSNVIRHTPYQPRFSGRICYDKVHRDIQLNVRRGEDEYALTSSITCFRRVLQLSSNYHVAAIVNTDWMSLLRRETSTPPFYPRDHRIKTNELGQLAGNSAILTLPKIVHNMKQFATIAWRTAGAKETSVFALGIGWSQRDYPSFFSLDLCNKCARPCTEEIVCSQCNFVRYCSERCLNSRRESHSAFCDYVSDQTLPVRVTKARTQPDVYRHPIDVIPRSYAGKQKKGGRKHRRIASPAGATLPSSPSLR
eukprot:TRINITY_DN3093_c1_g1_i4.p1 TRINITY_DN3093_c1_g1~~TRINITY_DN3093_c1_g1_i4.p1  ORF type:complete len:912 (+),score=189.53 TRINITY_DN3093_c1_g1_i4:623-3358(+)